VRCSAFGATTLNEYRKYIEKDAALERRFQSVKVEAPSSMKRFSFSKDFAENTKSITKPRSPILLSKRR
jgi:ATP-dependent Clp protease ATP-binding subunit ClpA